MAAANMIGKAVKGENVGQALDTDPTQSEYKLYQEAKREREEKEANAAAKAVTAAAKAKAALPAQPPQTPPAETSTQPAK
jgi:NifU-like protein involved in Fe-S cluster formation